MVQGVATSSIEGSTNINSVVRVCNCSVGVLGLLRFKRAQPLRCTHLRFVLEYISIILGSTKLLICVEQCCGNAQNTLIPWQVLYVIFTSSNCSFYVIVKRVSTNIAMTCGKNRRGNKLMVMKSHLSFSKPKLCIFERKKLYIQLHLILDVFKIGNY